MVLSEWFKIHYWPGLLLAVYIITVTVTYSIAVSNGHVYSLFPYVSDTGSIPPESCIFSEFFNIIALIMGITLYIRYRQVNFDINCGNIDVSKSWNTVSIWIAGVMCFGTTIAGNFQETAVLPVHMLGATAVFTGGVFYFIIQTRISFATTHKTNTANPNYGLSKNIMYLRAFLSFSLFSLSFVVSICGGIALSEFKGQTMIWWTEEHGAFQLRLASTFTEWILILFMFIYIVTFTNEFKSLQFEEIKFTSKNCALKAEQQGMV